MKRVPRVRCRDQARLPHLKVRRALSDKGNIRKSLRGNACFTGLSHWVGCRTISFDPIRLSTEGFREGSHRRASRPKTSRNFGTALHISLSDLFFPSSSGHPLALSIRSACGLEAQCLPKEWTRRGAPIFPICPRRDPAHVVPRSGERPVQPPRHRRSTSAR